MRLLDDPIVAGHIHSFFVLFWLAMVPVAIWRGWIDSVAFVSALSIAALSIGHWSAREAATAQRDIEIKLDRLLNKEDPA